MQMLPLKVKNYYENEVKFYYIKRMCLKYEILNYNFFKSLVFKLFKSLSCGIFKVKKNNALRAKITKLSIHKL